MGPFKRGSNARAVGWLVLLSCWAITLGAQPQNSSPAPAAAAVGAGEAAAATGAAAAECSLYILGGGGRILRAGMRCTGPQPTITLTPPHMTAHKANFLGVAIASSCKQVPEIYECMVTICAGRLVLTHSSVSWVRDVFVDDVAATVVCVVGDSRVEVRNSEFSRNRYTPLDVYGKAHLLLVASTIANNSVEGVGGGVIIDGGHVTITGSSKVYGNNASGNGGGVIVAEQATLRVDGNSNVTANTAGMSGRLNPDGTASAYLYAAGGGLYVINANVTLAGGSSVHSNAASGDGGGLYVWEGASVTLADGSSVQGNTAGSSGGGLCVRSATVTLTGGSRVQGNTAAASGGGFVFESSNAALTGGSRVHGNRALNGSGGGLSVGSSSHVVISNHSTISNNSCMGGVGGGIEVDTGDSVFNAFGRRVDGERVFDARGRVVVADVEGVHDYDYDEGIVEAKSRVPSSYSSVTISNSIVTNNTSFGSAGGGVAVAGNGSVELVGYTLLLHNSALNSSGGGVVLLRYGRLRADDSVVFADNSVGKGYVGSTIAAFDDSTLHLPRAGGLTKCGVGVYLGYSTCPAGEIQQHDMCVCCPQHTFSFTNASCEPCPRNGNCSGGSLVQPLPGYWSSAPTSVQMHSCPLSTTACNYTTPANVCNEGYTGPVCGACQLPWYGMLSPFRCGKCMLPKVQLGLYLLMSSACVIFAVATVYTTWRDNLKGNKAVLATDYIKVLVLFLQYTVLIGGVSVAWPLFDLQRWFQAVNVVFAMGSGQPLSLDCWLHHYFPQGKLPLAMQRQLVYFFAPVVLLAVVALLWLAWALVRWVVPLVCRPKEGATQQPASSVARKLPVTLLVVAFYAYPTLLRALLSFFACLRIDRVPPEVQLPPGASAPLNHTAGYWVSDITQQCFAGYHRGWALGLGVPSVLLWCIIVPVAMGLGLFLCRAKADEDNFREHFGFIYRSYKPERMWWEAVWAARTVVLTVISVFAIPMERYFAVLSLHMVFLVSAALQVVYQPYAFPTLHRMHMVSTCCLAATTLGALAMFAYDIQETTALRLRIAIAVLVLIVNIVFVAWCVWKLVPAVKGWCVAAYSMVKSGILWVVKRGMECAGHSKSGRGRGRGRRGRAGCCV